MQNLFTKNFFRQLLIFLFLISIGFGILAYIAPYSVDDDAKASGFILDFFSK